MKSDFKFSEIFSIIKSGITGALALTGICIILLAVGFTVRGQSISYFYSKAFAKCSLEGLFIATSSLGFIIGLIVRRHLPLIQKGIAPMAIVAVPLIIGVWLLDSYAAGVSLPHRIKLSDCTNNIANIQLKAPKGHAYHLELNVPGVQTMPNGTVTSSYRFSGRIRISNGASLVTEFPIGSDRAWLTASGFVLTGGELQNTNVPPLSQFIRPQENYDIQITLDPPPPPLAAIWLYWLQSRTDMEK